jgi:hypothetical protein
MHLDATDYRTLKAKLLDAEAFRKESYMQQRRSGPEQRKERIMKTAEGFHHYASNAVRKDIDIPHTNQNNSLEKKLNKEKKILW